MRFIQSSCRLELQRFGFKTLIKSVDYQMLILALIADQNATYQTRAITQILRVKLKYDASVTVIIFTTCIEVKVEANQIFGTKS